MRSTRRVLLRERRCQRWGVGEKRRRMGTRTMEQQARAGIVWVRQHLRVALKLALERLLEGKEVLVQQYLSQVLQATNLQEPRVTKRAANPWGSKKTEERIWYMALQQVWRPFSLASTRKGGGKRSHSLATLI